MVVSGEAEKSAMEIVNDQVTKFLDAMSSKKKDVILQLFNTTADDQKNVDEFMEKFQGIGITVESAMFNNNGGIESNVLIAEKIPGKVVMSTVCNMSYWRTIVFFQKLKIFRVLPAQLDG